MKNLRARPLFAHRPTTLACTLIVLSSLSGCGAVASGVISATATAGSLATTAVVDATTTVYHVGKAGVSALTP